MAVAPVVLPWAGKAAKGAAHTVGEALTADLAVVRWEGKRTKRRPNPTEYELHLNPAALGVAAVGLGLSMWLLQLRVGLAAPEMKGYWQWPDGTAASGEMFGSEKGKAPTRRVWIPD